MNIMSEVVVPWKSSNEVHVKVWFTQQMLIIVYLILLSTSCLLFNQRVQGNEKFVFIFDVREIIHVCQQETSNQSSFQINATLYNCVFPCIQWNIKVEWNIIQYHTKYKPSVCTASVSSEWMKNAHCIAW